MGVHKVHGSFCACTCAQGPHHHPWPRPSCPVSPHPACHPASSSAGPCVPAGRPHVALAMDSPAASSRTSSLLLLAACLAPAALTTQQGLHRAEELQCTQESPAHSQVFGVNCILSRNSSLKSSPFLLLLVYKEDPNPTTVPRAKLAALSSRVCRRGEPGQEGRKTPGLFQAVTWESHSPHHVPIAPQLSWTRAGAALGLPLWDVSGMRSSIPDRSCVPQSCSQT